MVSDALLLSSSVSSITWVLSADAVSVVSSCSRVLQSIVASTVSPGPNDRIVTLPIDMTGGL
jgi:hypothetical protein